MKLVEKPVSVTLIPTVTLQLTPDELLVIRGALVFASTMGVVGTWVHNVTDTRLLERAVDSAEEKLRIAHSTFEHAEPLVP